MACLLARIALVVMTFDKFEELRTTEMIYSDEEWPYHVITDHYIFGIFLFIFMGVCVNVVWHFISVLMENASFWSVPMFSSVISVMHQRCPCFIYSVTAKPSSLCFFPPWPPN